MTYKRIIISVYCSFSIATFYAMEHQPLSWTQAAIAHHQLLTTSKNEDSFTASCTTFSPDNSTLAFGSDEGAVRLFSREAGLQREYHDYQKSRDRIAALAFMNTAQKFVAGMFRTGLQIWDHETREYSHIDNFLKIFSCIVLPGNTIVTGQEKGNVVSFDIRQSGPVMRMIGEHASEVKTLASLGQEGIVAAGDCNGIINVWDMRQTKEAIVSNNEHFPLFVNALASKNNDLASGDSSQRIFLWRYINGQLRKTKELAVKESSASAIKTLAYTPDGSGLAYTLRDGKTYIYDINKDVKTEIACAYPQTFLSTYSPHALAFSPDCNELAIAHGTMQQTIKRNR